jgi:hypothetical protein
MIYEWMKADISTFRDIIVIIYCLFVCLFATIKLTCDVILCYIVDGPSVVLYLKLILGGLAPCYWGVVNGGCVWWSRQGASKPTKFSKVHPTVYDTARATRKKHFRWMEFWRMKSMFARWRGWLFIPSYESICVGFRRLPKGSISSQCVYMDVHKVVSVEWVLRVEIMGEPTNELSHPKIGVWIR